MRLRNWLSSWKSRWNSHRQNLVPASRRARSGSHATQLARIVNIEPLEPRELLVAPTVTLGNVVSLTEGFGYDSTIEGLGSSIDTTRKNVVNGVTTESVVNGTFTKSLGIRESGRFTMEAWFDPKPGVTQGVIWNYSEAYQLFRVGNRGLRMVLDRGNPGVSGSKFDVTVPDALTADAWNHVAMTFNGDRLQLFVNGVNVASVADTVSKITPLPLPDVTKVEFKSSTNGSNPQGGAGAIDEVRVWNLARTQAEIQEAMLTPLSAEPGLVASWTFDKPGTNSELDSSPTGNSLFVSDFTRFKNSAPQIGYVDVNLGNGPVTNATGLFVTYVITGGTAINDVDYVGSRFRKVSSDPTTERDGIIIPKGSSSGRIYFMARPDAIFESPETISIRLTQYTEIAPNDYIIGTTNTASINITDSGAFKPGFAVTDASGRSVTAASPLFVDPTTQTAKFSVRLTSEPDFSSAPSEFVSLFVVVNGVAQVDKGAGAASNITLEFTPANWDQPQTITLSNITSDNFITISDRAVLGSYQSTPLSVPYTLTPPKDARPEEGNPIDVAPLKPTINLTTLRNVGEDQLEPALVGVQLNTAAPVGGLDVFYTIAAGGTATSAVDFQSLSGVVHVDEGLLLATLPIFPINDQLDEGAGENLIIALTPKTTYISGAQTQATVTITDDDQARIVASNVTTVDLTTPKSLVRPELVLDEGANRYAFGEDVKPAIGTVGSFDSPKWTFTGGLSMGLASTLATATAVRGGDVGEGLDLDGNIVYAVNARGPGNLRVRDALFTDQVSQPNVTITAPSEILNWQNPNYGSTTNDNNLEVVMQSIRFSSNPTTLNVDLKNLKVGGFYKLQLLFHESNVTRGFDIFANGQLIYDDFSAGRVSTAGQGAVVTYSFRAAATTMNIVLNGAPTAFSDKNPILQGLTLEAMPAQEIFFDADQLNFTLANAPDATSKIRVKFTPSAANGQPLVPTVVSGGDYLNTINIADMFNATSFSTGTLTRLQGGSLATPRLPTVVGDDTLEWSLSGLSAGTYQLVLAASASPDFAAVLGGGAGVSYDYEAVFTSSPTAPYQLSPSKGVTSIASTYAQVVTVENVPSIVATEPNNSATSPFNVGVVSDGITLASQVLDTVSDLDFFRFKLDSTNPAGRPDSLVGLFRETSTDLTLDLLNNTTGAVIKTSAAPFENEFIDLSSLADGEYLARVSGTNSSLSNAKYELKFRTFKNSAEPENNGTFATATYLGVAADGDRYNDFSVTPADEDFYRFTLNTAAGRPATVNLISTSSDGNLAIYLLDAAGQTITLQNANSNLKTLFLSSLADGDYGLRIFGSNSLANKYTANKYDLTFGTIAPRANEFPSDRVALRLDTKPTANVTLALTNGDPTEGQISSPTLTFTPDNWDQYQLVSVTSLDDATADGDVTYFITATATSSDPYYQNRTLQFDIRNVDRGNFVAPPVTNSDKEPSTSPIVSIAAIPTAPTREGATLQAFRISLNQALTTSLTVGIDFARGTAVFGSDFTPVPETGVKVLDTGIEVTIPAGSTSKTFSVTLFDDQVDELSRNEEQKVALIGGSGTDTFTLTFNGQTTVPIAQNATEETVRRALEALLSLGAGNVGVVSVPDGFIVSFQGNRAGTDVPQMTGVRTSGTTLSVAISTVATSNDVLRAALLDRPGYRLATGADPGLSAKMEIIDINQAGYTVLDALGQSAFFLKATTAENSATTAAKHTIQLQTKPVANVTVYVASSDPTEGVIQLDPAKPGSDMVSLKFTPDNWNQPQTFYVKGVDDTIDDGDVPFKFVVSARSEDVVYEQLASNSYDARNTDNDAVGITVSSPQATVSGRVNVFSVVLNTAPIGEVRVTMTPQNDQIEVNGSRGGDPSTLTFNPNNWNIPQLVRVVAVDDKIVEYFHKSQINFAVEVGQQLRGPSIVDNSVLERAVDLGDITGGIRWSGLSVPLVNNSLGLPLFSDQYFRFTLPRLGTSLDKIRLQTETDPRFAPNIFLYTQSGSTFNFFKRNDSINPTTDASGNVLQPALSIVSLDSLPAGDYVMKIAGQSALSSPSFELRFDDADRAFESVTLQPVPVSIKDNDLPTAEILAGPTASEVFSQASYFAVRLNAPTPAGPADTGLKVNFKVTGGRASQGIASSTLHDYTVVADSFDPATGIGWVRVAPGDVQANIGIVPVDDKLVEDLPLTLRGYSYNTTTGSQIRIAADSKTVEATGATGTTYAVKKGTQLIAQLPGGKELLFTVRADTNLVKGNYLVPGTTVTRNEYAAVVAVDLPTSTFASDNVLATVPTANTEYFGRIKSEDVEVTLLTGSGYVLPLAPNKQAADPNVAANLDPARTVARLTIFDDDVPGIQIFEIGEHTTLAEGTQTTFQVSLTAEPLTSVMLTLSGGGFEFVNPLGNVPGSFTQTLYSQGGTVPANLSLSFVSLYETDEGFTAVFDAHRTRVTQTATPAISKLTLTGTNGGGSSVVEFEVPGLNDVDAAGNPEVGNWNTDQRLVVTNLVKNADGSFSISANLDGTTTTVTLTPYTTTTSPKTTTLTFAPSDWYKPQTVTIKALNNSVSEPGEWHKEQIQYVASGDGNFSKLAIPAQEIHVIDALLDVGDTVEAVRSGMNMLQDSLLGLKVPLVGTVGDLPGIGSLFNSIVNPLQVAIAGQDELTTTKFKALAESALQPFFNRGTSGTTFDRVHVEPVAEGDDARVELELEKRFKIGSFNLSTDLGLDALGLRFMTTGKVSAEVLFELHLGVGVSPKFGVYVDTAFTRLHMGMRLFLEGNGATTENPNNLFTGQGSLGFLQVDFQDDPLNPTQLGITFDVTLNDIDNLNTVKFFDINGDGLLAEKSYSFKVGTDANKDGRIDLDANGNPILRSTTVAEPWSNISKKGVVDPFPTVPQLKDNANLKQALQANWNTTGTKYNTFDEATSIRNEGVYRTLIQGGQTIVYFDLNRDGQLDIANRSINPFNSPWTGLISTKPRDASEIWFTPANPKNFGELKILKTGTGTATKYFLDVNQNKVADGPEIISDKLRKKIDKNNNLTLDADIQQDGEGKFVQGMGFAFLDMNGNKKMDFDESFINYGFDNFHMSESVFIADPNAAGGRFLDLNGDGFFGNGFLTQNLNYQEFKLRTTNGGRDVYIDINNNSVVDPNEPLASVDPKNPETTPPKAKFTIRQDMVKDASQVDVDLFKNLGLSVGDKIIQIGNLTFPVRTISGAQFIDIDKEVDPTNGPTGKYRQLGPPETVRFIDLDNNGQLTLDIFGRSLEPYATQASNLSLEALNRLVGKFNPLDPTLFSTVSTEVKNLTTTGKLSATEEFNLRRRLEELTGTGKIVVQLNDGDRLTLAEMRAFLQANKAQSTTKADQVKNAAAQLFTYQFQGDANLGLSINTSVSGLDVLPSMQFDLAVNMPLFNFSNAQRANDDGMTIEFRGVALDLGSFLNKFVTPIIDTANEIVTPIKPIIAALNADTKLLGYVGLASAFESDGKPGVSLLEIARKLARSDAQKAKIDQAIKFADHLDKLVNLIDVLHKNLNTSESLLQFGDFQLNNLRGASDNRANAVAAKTKTPRADGAPTTTTTLPPTDSDRVGQQAAKSSAFKDKYNALKQLQGFSFNLFDPGTVLSLIKGDDNVDLIKYDIPDFAFDFNIERKFSIWGPLAGKLEGGFNVATDLAMGFDTHGFQEWAKAGYDPDHSNLIFDGLYFNDWNLSGADKDELTVKAYIAAGAGIDVGIASGFVKGGVEGIIGLDLVDVGEQSGTSDGKIRGSDLIEKLSNNPADLFDLHGVINAFLGAEVTVDFFFFSETVYEARLATFELAKFKLNSSGFSGSALNGKVQAGPIAHSTVWFDANNNHVRDEGEPFTVTDFEGNYHLEIPDEFDRTHGVIRTEGGVDVTTGLEMTVDLAIPAGGSGNATAFTALETALVQLPIDVQVLDFNNDDVADEADRAAYLGLLEGDPTNLAYDFNGDETIDVADVEEFDELLASAMRDGKLTADQAQTKVKRAFGIDPSVDLSTFLHFEEALEGNPLATQVFVGENILNTIVAQVDAVLAGLAGVSLDDRQYSGVFSEAALLAVAKQLMQIPAGETLDLSDSERIGSLLLDAIYFAEEFLAEADLPIELNYVHLEEVFDDLTLVIHTIVTNALTLVPSATDQAELTQFVTQFKVFANGQVTQALYGLANGTLSAEEVLSENVRTGEEFLEFIQHVPLPPLLSNVNDVFLFENESATDIPVTLRRQKHDAGNASLEVSADNLVLLPEGSVTLEPGTAPGEFFLSIRPAANQHGVAHITLRGVDSDGGSIEEVILVTVEGVNDAPLPENDTVLAIAGTTIDIEPLANDVDPDGDQLHLDGLLQAPATGQITTSGDELIHYTVDSGSRGPLYMVYEVEDRNGGTGTATVTINALAPLTVDHQFVVASAGGASSNSGTLAKSNDVTAVLSASIGQVTDNGDGTWSWSLAASNSFDPTQTVTITATYNGTLQDHVSFQFLTLAVSDTTVIERQFGRSDAVFTVTLSGPSQSLTTVDFQTSNGDGPTGAIAPSDFIATRGTLRFQPGETKKTIRVPIQGDTTNELDEAFFVSLSNATNATISANQGIGIIRNDEVNILVNDVTLREGDRGTKDAIFTVSLSKPQTLGNVTVAFSTADGTATAGADYLATSGILTFTPGQITKKITVPVVNDRLYELNETFVMNLSGSTNAVISDGQGLGTIKRNDALPELSVSDVTVTEGTGNALFTVLLSTASSLPITVAYSTSNKTANSSADYTASMGTLYFAPGETSQTISVAITDDAFFERAETFAVDISTPKNATIADRRGIGTIEDNDSIPTLSIGDVTVIEGTGNTAFAIFTVSLSSASQSTVTVAYATSHQTATDVSDYVSTSGKITFMPGETSKTIQVAVVGDQIKESDEVFSLNLHQAVNALLADDQAIGTILDND